MSRTRVAFFAEILLDDFDGASRTIFQIINRIPTTDFDYHFFCGIPSDKPFEFPVHTVPTFTIPINKTYKVALPLWAKSRIIDALDSMKPEVIHISTPSPLGELGLHYAKKHGIPVITIYHTHFVSYVQFYLKRFPRLIRYVERFIEKRLKRFYNQCDLIYVPTEIMMHELIGYGIESQKMKLWPRALTEGIFSPAKADPNFKKKHGLSDKPVILYASRLVYEKNVLTLVDMYKKAQVDHPDYRFVVVGDGVANGQMRHEMPEAIFLGHLSHSELATVYASCDIYVFTSITETFGNVVIEAMASGLPCVIANGGGSAAFIESGVNGYLATYNDAADYLAKIENILHNPALKQSFIDKGIEYTDSLTWPSLINTYLTDIRILSSTVKKNDR